MKDSFSSLSDLAAAFPQSTDNTNSRVRNNDDNLVYSTCGGRIKSVKEVTAITPSDGFAKVRRETKGRKGKGVVTITGLGIDTKALKDLAKKLKKICGSGGTVIGEIIEIQGDKRDVIKLTLEKSGYKVKFTGG